MQLAAYCPFLASMRAVSRCGHLALLGLGSFRNPPGVVRRKVFRIVILHRCLIPSVIGAAAVPVVLTDGSWHHDVPGSFLLRGARSAAAEAYKGRAQQHCDLQVICN